MSNTYLDRFRSALPSTQGNQILRLLTAKRDSGEIKSVDEFKQKLKDLTAKLLAERITPTFELLKAVPGEDTSSEQYNEMLDRIYDDLEAAFDEADNIDSIIEAHNNLINNVSLKTLRFGVNELESKVRMYEFLNKNVKGFDSAIFNTFRESLNHVTSRSDEASSLVFVDPRKQESIPVEEDAEVDFVGERLILGPSVKNYLSVRNAEWLSSANSIRSELDVSFPNSKISNITDNKKNTFWVEPILLTEINPGGVGMEVALHVNASQDVNFVEIEPASDFPMVLVGIDYYDASNTRQVASSTEVTLYGPVRINFKRITCRSIILRLRQDNYGEVQFKKKLGESQFHYAFLGENKNTVDKDSISEELQNVLTSDFILSDVMAIRNTDTRILKYYQYLLGLDNVRIGFSLYDSRSVYVSEGKKIDNLGQVALRVEEVRPLQGASATASLETHKYLAKNSDDDAKFHHGVTEYYTVAQHFTKEGLLVATDVLPTLPLGANRVYHEQLILTATTSSSTNPNVGQLRFFTDDDETDVLVYRNNTLLSYGLTASDDWEFVENTDLEVGDLTVISPNVGRSMKRAIKIKSTVNTLDVFTVSYTPKVSNSYSTALETASLINTVDLVGDNSARMVNENIIVFESIRSSQNIAHTRLFLLIIMRRNSAVENFSPAVEEYMIVTGSKNSNKFTGE